MSAGFRDSKVLFLKLELGLQCKCNFGDLIRGTARPFVGQSTGAFRIFCAFLDKTNGKTSAFASYLFVSHCARSAGNGRKPCLGKTAIEYG